MNIETAIVPPRPGTEVTSALLDDLLALARVPLSAAVQASARLRLLDYLGCVLAGAEMERARALRLLDLAGGSAGSARLFGLGRRADPTLAALVNGGHAHVAELDDGNRFGMVHPGVPVISAILAMAAAARLSDDDILRGLVTGYEAAVRLARAVQPAAKNRGLHATGVCGTVGAAVGVAAALGLDRAGMTAALAGGCSSAAGMLKVIRGASQLKPFNAGFAAQSGLSAALLAQAGYLGPDDVLDGPHGFLAILRGGDDGAGHALAAAARPAVDEVYVKPYASCRHCHAPVEAALTLRARPGFDLAAIDRVIVRSHRMAVQMHDHVEIAGSHSGKMSIPYCVAAALVTGEAGMTAFAADRLADPRIQALTRRVDTRIDPAMTAQVPQQRPAEVEIVLHSGLTLAQRIDLPRGEPETALTVAELCAKFHDLAAYGGLDADLAGQAVDILAGPGTASGAIGALLDRL